MKIRSFAVLSLFLLATFGMAQVPSKNIEAGNQVLVNISKLNVVKFVLPLLLNKKQIGDLMATLEKCRSKEMEVREADAKELLKLDAEVKSAIEKAVEKGDYPDKAFQSKILAVQEAIIIRRKIALGENVELLDETVKRSLDSGQQKVMVNALDPKSVDPSIKTSSMTDDDKRKFYIKAVFLDGLTYELLKVMYKKAS